MHRSIAPLVASVAVLGITAATASAETTVDFGHQIRSEQSFTLKSNTTKRYTLPIAGLGQNQNVLEPCYGFAVNGPGVKLAASNLIAIGPVVAEPGHEQDADGGIPNAVRQADGSFAVPASAAKLTAWNFTTGGRCAAADWSFYDAAGHPQVDGTSGGPGSPSGGAVAAKASKRTARAAQAGSVQIKLAALTGQGAQARIVVDVVTGKLAGKTTLTEHATVLPQVVDPASR